MNLFSEMHVDLFTDYVDCNVAFLMVYLLHTMKCNLVFGIQSTWPIVAFKGHGSYGVIQPLDYRSFACRIK